MSHFYLSFLMSTFNTSDRRQTGERLPAVAGQAAHFVQRSGRANTWLMGFFGLILSWGLTLTTQAQNFAWAKQFSSSVIGQGYSVMVDGSGNVYTTGTFWGTADFDPGPGVVNLTAVGLNDIFVSKLDASGNFLWAKQFGATGTDNSSTLAIDGSGNVYTTGYFEGTGDFDPGPGVVNLTSAGDDIFVSKLDASGNLLWVKQIGGAGTDHGGSVTVDGAGNVYTIGSFNDKVDFDPGPGVINLTSAGVNDIFLSKLDASGNFLWVKQFGGTGTDLGGTVAVDGSGNIYTIGSFQSTVDFDPGSGVVNLTSAGSFDIFVSKLDASGNFLWVKQIGSTGGDIGESVTVDGAGNVYTTGSFSATVDFDPGPGVVNLTSAGGEDIFVSKLDASGNFLWAKRIGGTSDDKGYVVALDGSGNIYTTGTFQNTADFDPGSGVVNLTSAGGNDIFVSKLDASGNFLWAKQFGGSGADYGNSLAVDGSGNIYTTGAFQSTVDFDPGAGTFNLASGGSQDIFVSKLNQLDLVATPNLVCAGSSTSLSVTASGGSAPYTYTWTAPVGTTLSATNTASVSATVSVAGVQTFTVSVAGTGGPLTSATVSVTVNTSPSVSISANPSLTVTQGSSVTLTASGGPGQPATSYNWSGGETTPTISASVSGTYSVTGTIADCSSSTSVLVSVTAITISGLATTSSTVCAGNVASFTATLANVAGGYSYTLTNGSLGAPASVSVTGTATTTSFSQTLVVDGSGSQSFSLVVSASGGSSVASTNLTVGTHPDYQALVDFYNSTNGASWTRKTGWLTSCDPCGWYGVTCTGGRVSRLNLSSNQLSGSIPSSLSALTNLKELWLRDNNLSGSIPASLSALTNLTEVRLSNNHLSGSIPASLNALTNLTYLGLNTNQLSGSIPASLSALANLTDLYLNSNQLSGSIPSSLSALTKLTYLALSDNQLSGSIPESLSALTNLTDLQLSNNELSGSIPASLSALTNLTYLALSDNQLSGSIPESLSALTNLTDLWLLYNQLSGSIPSSLGALTKLTDLQLNNNQLSGSIPASLSALTNLTDLRLYNNQLSGCYPASLTALCGILFKAFYNNAGLPGGGSTAAFNAFCSTGQGSDAFVATATASSLTGSVGAVVSLSTAGGSSYSWLAPAGATLTSSASSSVVSASLTTSGLKTFTLVVSNGGTCSQTTTVSVTASGPALIPTLTGFAATSSTVCAGSVATFTATVGNVTGDYSYTLTNGSLGAPASVSVTGTATTTSFSQTLVVDGSGSQSFSLVVSDNGSSGLASTSLTVGTHPDLQTLTDLYNSTNGSGWTNKTGWLTNCNPCGWFGITCSGGRVSQINLSNNELSGSIPSSLSALTNLTYLHLSNNELSGSIPSSLDALTNLTYLALSTNQLSGSIPASLSALTNLTFLLLSTNQLSGSIPASLSTLTKLTSLNLGNNQLSGSIPASLSALTKLTSIWLYSNQLSGSIPSSLSALTNLTYLNLADNELSGCYPASLTALCGIQAKSFTNNAGLPGGGSDEAFAAFCSTGQGSDAFVATATASSLTGSVGAVVSLSTAGGSSYSWLAPAGATLTSSASSSVVSASLTTTGVKTFTVVVSNGGTCSQIVTVSVTGTAALPTLSGFATTSGTVCAGSVATFTATVGNVTGNYSYTLANGISTATGTSTNPAFSRMITATASGVQLFTLTVSSNGQFASATSELSVNATPIPTLTASNETGAASNMLTCAQTSLTLTASGGNNYLFSGTGLVSQSPTSGTAVVNAAGTYSVTVTSAGGCSATTTTTVNSNTTVPSVSINPSSTTLTNASPAVSLTAVGTGTLLWSTGATTQVISVSTSGTYSVTLTNPNGCTASASVPVIGSDLTVNLELPQANFASSGTAAVGNFLVNVFEVAGLPTSSGNVTITITAPVGYTLAFVSSLTSINVSGGEKNPVVVNNPQWTVTQSLVARQLTMTMNSGAFIGGGGKSSLGFSLTRTTANSGSSANITVNVADDLTRGYDGNLSNNVYARIISGL